VRSEIPSQNSV